MIKYVIIALISMSILADLDSIENDQISMIEHVGKILSGISKENAIDMQCSTQVSASNKSCSPVIVDYMKDREYQGSFSILVDENPRELCTGVQLNDSYYTSADKLDNFFQEYTSGMVPAFNQINQGCFQGLTSLKDQNSAISYYYYAQMRLLQDGIVTLTSSAAIDKKLGKPILADFNCKKLGRLEKLCSELKTCQGSSMDLSNDIADTQMAIDLRSRVENSETKTDVEEQQRDQILGGIKVLYPWLEGKEFEKNFDQDKIEDPKHVEAAIVKQLEATREKMKERISKYENLSNCIENRTNDCSDFHEKLNELTEAPVLGTGLNERDIFGRYYQNQQSCINNQRNYRNSANESVNDFLIGSGLTVATMGLGTIAVGSGHLIKGIQTTGALSRTQKAHKALASLSVQHSNKIKLGAKYLALSLNGTFSAKGINDAVTSCENDLSHLSEFKRLTGADEKPSLCPKENQNPEFELMSDIKACAINAALSSLDFLPIVPYGVAKYRASRPNTKNLELLEEAELMMDPDNMTLREMEPGYLEEEKGLSERLSRAFSNPRHEKFIPRKTKYLKSDKMRKKFQVEIRDGKLYDSQGRALNSSDEMPGIYVIDKNGVLYHYAEPDAGRFHHSTFLAGDDVLSAGQIRVRDGEIVLLGNESGHYKPTKMHAYQGIYKLLKSGVDLSKARLLINDYPEHL